MTSDIAICAIFRDEADYLAEWIEYHLLVGVDHLFLYNHRSEDHYEDVLAPYIRDRVVTLIEWDYDRLLAEDPKRRNVRACLIQPVAYDHAITRLRGRYRWLLFIDIDEFLTQMSPLSLRAFLARHEDAACVSVNWAIFGTSGHEHKVDGLVIENYTVRNRQVCYGNRHLKAFVDPYKVSHAGGPHHFVPLPEMQDKKWIVTEHGDAIPCGPEHAYAISPHATWDFFRLNHYVTKSLEEILHKRMVRGDLGTGTWTEQMALKHLSGTTFDEVEDLGMRQFIPEIKQRLAARALPLSPATVGG